MIVLHQHERIGVSGAMCASPIYSNAGPIKDMGSCRLSELCEIISKNGKAAEHLFRSIGNTILRLWPKRAVLLAWLQDHGRMSRRMRTLHRQ
jgi:hypothetical protein